MRHARIRNIDLLRQTRNTKWVPGPNRSQNPGVATSLPLERRSSARLLRPSASPGLARPATRAASKPGPLFAGQSPRLTDPLLIFLQTGLYDSVLRRSINASSPTLLLASEIGNRYFATWYLRRSLRFTCGYLVQTKRRSIFSWKRTQQGCPREWNHYTSLLCDKRRIILNLRNIRGSEEVKWEKPLCSAPRFRICLQSCNASVLKRDTSNWFRFSVEVLGNYKWIITFDAK